TDVATGRVSRVGDADVLLDKSGSLVSDVTVAVSVNDVASEPDGTATVTVRVIVAPLATVPRSQVTVWPEPVQPAAETKETPAGSVSLRTTPSAALGPLLRTVSVDVS